MKKHSRCNRIVLTFGSVFLAMLAGAVPGQAQTIDDAWECVIEPRRLVKIGSQVAGILEAVMVDRGDVVKEGQVIGRLRSDVERANVELARAQAETETRIKAAQSQVEFERRRQERNQQLYRTKVISSENIDRVETELALREQELVAAREAKNIAALELKRATELLNIRTIRSPISGIVVERNLSAGEFILNEGSVATVAQVDPLNVEVFVPIRLYPDIRAGMAAKVMPEEPVGGELDAEVTVVDQVFDAASGTFGIRLTLPNPAYKVPAGLRCLVRFIRS